MDKRDELAPWARRLPKVALVVLAVLSLPVFLVTSIVGGLRDAFLSWWYEVGEVLKL